MFGQSEGGSARLICLSPPTGQQCLGDGEMHLLADVTVLVEVSFYSGCCCFTGVGGAQMGRAASSPQNLTHPATAPAEDQLWTPRYWVT